MPTVNLSLLVGALAIGFAMCACGQVATGAADAAISAPMVFEFAEEEWAVPSEFVEFPISRDSVSEGFVVAFLLPDMTAKDRISRDLARANTVNLAQGISAKVEYYFDRSPSRAVEVKAGLNGASDPTRSKQPYDHNLNLLASTSETRHVEKFDDVFLPISASGAIACTSLRDPRVASGFVRPDNLRCEDVFSSSDLVITLRY